MNHPNHNNLRLNRSALHVYYNRVLDVYLGFRNNDNSSENRCEK